MQLKLRPYQNNLIKDVYHSMQNGKKKPLVVLPTGGGKTAVFAWMASKSQEKGKTVWFVVHRKELLEQTEATFKKFEIPLKTIYITMVRGWRKLPPPDLIVVDEAHHSQAKTWRDIFEQYTDVFTIGLTATPSRLDGKPLGALYDEMILGPSTSQLIESGYLAQYKIFTPNLNMKNLIIKRGEYDLQEASKQLRNSTVYAKVVETYKEKAFGKRAIYFCSTVEHSKETADAFNKSGIKAMHFDGTTNPKERKRIVDDFRKGEIQILCNVDLIGEGFDVPACDAVGMLRPTASLSIYLQQAGRCLRPVEGKVAVILDHVGNLERHGFPNDTRDWNLSNKVVTGRKVNRDGSFETRQCKECFSAFSSHQLACPVCGSLYESTNREISQMEEVELKEAIQRRQAEYHKYLLSPKAIAEADSYSEFCEIAKARGYKRGWAKYRAEERGLWTPQF